MSGSERFDLLYSSRQSDETQMTSMDIFGLTPQEYGQASPLTIAGEIKETGKEIFAV